jgi:hypothetical protein
MVAVTYGVARVARTPAKAAARAQTLATPNKSLFERFIAALVESRVQQAHREIVRHAHLLPSRGKDASKDTPIGGW